ncbi:MAG: hypothetical protein GXP25_03080 [Planctomycetes bacterium]|nr:hypothetical protein [Planctomycetota bacterium]
MSIKRTAVYGHIIAQYNLDPALAYGKYMLEKIPKVFQSYREKKGGELDGFYYDGITTGINYRREHFKYANYPPVWDPVNKKPFLYNYFSSVEFAKEAADRLHADGKITMMNGAMGSSFYTAPHLDVMGAETGLRIKRSDFNYVRTICRHKPFVTLLKGNFSKLTKEDFALFMKRCVAYGVFPGFFDWPPSGLGPGSRYWDHAEWYDRDRLNHRLYQALCRQIAAAGWEPLTLARSSNAEFSLERFGSLEKGEVFFTVLNDTSFSGEAVISMPSADLPKDWVVVDEVSRRRLDGRVEGGQLRVPLALGAESLAVLHVTSKQRLAAGHADEILRNFELRKQMAEIDKDRPERLVHWRGTRYGSYERARVDGRSCFKLSNDTDKPVKGAMQWVMLYQEQAEPLKLRLKLKSDNVKPGKGGRLLVDTVLCHVNMKTRFTERKREKYDLDVGTYDWREKEIIIKPERPLRSIQLFVYLWKCSGTVWIDEISITPADKPDREYVVDPKMEQWYENLSAEKMNELDAKLAEIEADLKGLKARGDGDVADECVSILGKLASAKKWIADNRLGNPARRSLRELDAAASRLSLVCSTLMGISGPNIMAPTTAVPGEQIAIEVDVAGVRADQVEYRIDVPEGWAVKGTGKGKFAVTVPKGALGTTGLVRLTALVKPKPGLMLPLEGTTQVRIVPALESEMRLTDVSASGEEFRFAVDVSNNDRTPSEVALKTILPEGWQAKAAEPKCTLPPKSRKTMTFSAIAGKGAAPGRYEVRAELSSPKLAEACAFSETVFYLPGTLNRLKNAGFEEGETGWSKSERGYVIDPSQSHSGKYSLKLHNASTSERSSASQTITLNQKTPCPIVVRGRARAERVSGHPGRTFSVYVDIYYTDGTPLYGQTIDWRTGTTGWQYGELTIEPAKPIRNVNVYCLLRRHSGTAWFDDLFVAEDPTRRGNIARQAKVSVDSCYGQYTAAPINDGVTRTEGLHWTKESWASAEMEEAHWVVLAFDKPVTMGKVVIHWSMDAGVPRTSRRIELQSWTDGKWQTISERRMSKAEPVTVVDLGKEITTQKLRVFQAKGCGVAGRPNLMWVREIEIYEK